MWKLTLLSFCLFLAIPCQAKIITVDDDGQSDFNTIQAAIDDVNTVAGDEIVVSEGTYYESINTNGKAITIRSTNPLDPNTVLNTVINPNSSVRCIYVISDEDANTVIKGFLLTGGIGGINCIFSSPTFTNCSISGNSGGMGMGCLGSNPTLTNCTFSGNLGNNGGGILCNSSNPTLTNCTFSGNSAGYYGGGMYCSGSSPTLTNCTFSGNSAGRYGGGMYCVSDSNPTLTNCTFIVNDANTGGGIYCSDSNPTLTNCTFSGNSAGYYGSGIYSEFANPILTDSFLCGNFISDTLALSQIEGSFTDNGGNFINNACPPPVAKIEGDLDGDGVVDFGDVAILCNNWLAGK